MSKKSKQKLKKLDTLLQEVQTLEKDYDMGDLKSRVQAKRAALAQKIGRR